MKLSYRHDLNMIEILLKLWKLYSIFRTIFKKIDIAFNGGVQFFLCILWLYSMTNCVTDGTRISKEYIRKQSLHVNQAN